MFITHTGERVVGIRLVKARQKVSDDLIKLAYAIFDEDAYATHVTKQQKHDILLNGLRNAEAVKHRTVFNFTVNQRINQVLTGECVSLLNF